MPKMEMEALADALHKATKVADGCKKELELIGAMGYMAVLSNRFRYTLDRAPLMNFLVGELVNFIIDTRMHFQEGFHKSAKTDWKVNRVHPNIKDYFYKHLDL